MFNHSVYAMLLKNNPVEAKKYIETSGYRKSNKERQDMVDFLKTVGIRIFPNYTDETVEKKYNEALLAQKEGQLSAS